MSTTIDERVVEMRFDNSRFERNVQTSLSTLDKLKNSLNLSGATKGFEEIDNASKKVNMSGLGSAVESVRMKFSALEVMAVTALANITNSAINTGKKLVSSLTIDPIKSGFQEYETQINAVQTILANTSSKGTTLDQVNNALDELNEYADQTIYNFTEMTRNIGTFTAAGVDLDKSVTSIKGIANLAAASGSNAQQASTAMYQLSQAIAAGKVQLMDWNSVVNAGMGGELFQNALKRTAEHFGYNVDTMISKYGSFRESLTEGGWLTTEVLTETLTQLSGAYTEADLIAQGYSEEQAKEITQLAQTASDAATKVKTFTQLFDTLKEAAQSGWTQSWEIIVGDFEEAKELLTEVSNVFGKIINDSAEARNSMLQGWKDLGGRVALVDALRNSFEGIMSVIAPIKEAFREIFPPITAQQLYGFTEGLKTLTERLTISEETSKNLKNTFKGLFAVLDIVRQVIMAVFDAIGSLLGGVGSLGSGVLGLTGSFGEWLVKLNEFIKQGDIFNKIFGTIANVIKTVATGIRDFINLIAEKLVFPGFELFHSLLERVQTRMSQVGETVGGMENGVISAFDSMGRALESCQFIQLLQALWDVIKKIGSGIASALGKIGSALSESLGNANFSGIIDLLNGISFGAIAIGITKFVGTIKEQIDSIGSIKDSLIGILDSVRGCFEAYQTQLKAGALLKIAAAIAILVASLVTLALIDSDKLSKSLSAITVLFADLMASMAIFNKISGQVTGTVKSTTAMLGMSTAVLILASALKKIGDLDIKQLSTGLVGITGLSAIMIAAAKIMGSGGKTIIKGSSQMVIFAAAIKILASACEDLSSLDWNQLAKGLVGVGVLLAEVSLFMNTAKFSGKSMTTATGIVILAGAIKILASACYDFAQMKWGEIGKGLSSIAVLLAEITVFTNLTGNAKNVISTGVALVAIGAAIKIFASAVKDFSTMQWNELAIGLTGMAGALTAVTIAVKLMPKNMVGIGTGLIAVSTALLIMATALGKMGSMEWEGVAKGLTTLGGSMAIMAIGLKAMTGTLSGSAAMMVAASALAVLAPVLSILGAMSWEAIAKGLVALAGAFTVIGIAGAVLTPLVPAILGLSAAIALLGVAVLGIGGGLLAAGAGLSAMAVGFTALAAAGTAGATAIVASLTVIITGIIEIIPAIAQKIGEAVIVFCEVIANSAGPIGEAIKEVVLMLIDVLVECVPTIADGALKLIAGVLEALVQYTPQIVDSLFQFLIGVLEGIARNLPGLIKAAIDVLMAFFSGIVEALKGIDTETLLQGIVGIGLLSGIMAALSAIAGLVPGAMLGVLGIGAVIAELALVLAAIGALAQIPGLDWLINEGGNLLQGIGTAIGKFIGGIVGGFMSGVSSQFPQIGSDLSAFMVNVQPFLNGAASIDPAMMEGVKALAETILILTASNILEGLTSWLTGGSSLANFASELIPFGSAMRAFSAEVSGLDGETVSNAAIAGKTLAEMAATLPNSGGVVGFFAGENDMNAFGEQLIPFGRAIKAFAAEVTGLDVDVVTNAATAGKAMAEMASTVPNSGGVVGFFTGENDMDMFGEKLVPFGEAMMAFGKAVKDLDSDAVTNASTAGKALAELANTVPNSGGVVGFFTGENDMDMFGEQLVPFGEAMMAFSNSVKGIDSDAIMNSTTAGKALVELANTVPNSGGVVGFFTGENDMSIFGAQLILFGKAMKSYSESIGGIDAKAIIASATAGRTLSELETNLPNIGGLSTIINGGNNLASFAYELIPFGRAMKSYSDSIRGIDTNAISASGIAALTLAELETNLPDIGGLSTIINGKNSLTSFARELIPFGTAIKAYATEVTGINFEAVTASTIGARSLSELEANLPDMGGLATIIDGKHNLLSFAAELPPFGRAMKSYSASVSGIDSGAVIASSVAAQSLSELETELPDVGGLLAIIEGDNTLGRFAEGLNPFGRAMKSYSDSVSGINPEAVTASSIAAQSLSELEAGLPDVGGIKSWFNGDNNLNKFAEGLIPFGEGMKSYSDSVSGIDSESAIASTIAAKSLAELISNLPPTGGILGWFDGQNDLGKFAQGLTPFGKAMKSYSDAVVGIDANSVTASAIAAKSLTELESKLSSNGNFANWINGNNTLSTFAADLVPFGKAMKDYSKEIVGIDSESIVSSATSAKSLTELANSLPPITGISQWFSGTTDVETFCKRLVPFGKAMKDYSLAVTGLDANVVTNSANTAKALVELSNNLPNNGGIMSLFAGDNDIASFGNQLVSFGQSFASYYASVNTIDTTTLNGVIVEFRNLVDLANGTKDIDTSGMSNFATNLTNLGNSGIDGFVNAFTNANSRVSSTANTMISTFISGAEAKRSELASVFTSFSNSAISALTSQQSEFTTTGSTVMSNFITGANNKINDFKSSGQMALIRFVSGINSKKQSTKDSFIQIVSYCVTETRNKYNDFYNAGKYLVEGFANGIDQYTYLAKARAEAMARAAASAAEKELDINSPSKVGGRIGGFFGLGFVNALANYSNKSYKAGTQIALAAKNGLNNAVSNIRDFVEGKMDLQPTIRPVLDLSGVRSEANHLSAILSKGQAIKISSFMNRDLSVSDQNAETIPSVGNTYSFVQNNYSPKALSRIDIYRQTKNQFSVWKGVVGT